MTPKASSGADDLASSQQPVQSWTTEAITIRPDSFYRIGFELDLVDGSSKCHFTPLTGLGEDFRQGAPLEKLQEIYIW